MVGQVNKGYAMGRRGHFLKDGIREYTFLQNRGAVVPTSKQRRGREVVSVPLSAFISTQLH